MRPRPLSSRVKADIGRAFLTATVALGLVVGSLAMLVSAVLEFLAVRVP